MARRQATLDPVEADIKRLEAELRRGQLQLLVKQMHEDIGPFLQGQTAAFPDPASLPEESRRRWWQRRRETAPIAEAIPQTAPVRAIPPMVTMAQIAGTRQGFISGVGFHGTDLRNPGWSTVPGALDRPSQMNELAMAYVTCAPASAAVDVISRTTTAGGLGARSKTSASMAPDALPVEPPPAAKRLQALLDHCNPYQDIRQLARACIQDLLIFGDTFIEVSWFSFTFVGRTFREPVALWPLDAATMSEACDAHGIVSGYDQQMSNGRMAHFGPDQIIHVRFDSPNGGPYGLSPLQKARVSVMTWVFAAALVKETMRKGDPPRLWVDWPVGLPDATQRALEQQYAARNVGVANIGNLFETRGGTVGKEMSVNKIDFWNQVKLDSRDEIMSEFGVPPSKAAIIESGNLGGGTGTAQDKTFRVNTCGTVAELFLEKLTFALCVQAFGLTDWEVFFREIDWRDDIVVEQIRDIRLRNGAWTLNRYLRDIDEPQLPEGMGGDEHFIVNRQDLVLYSDLVAMSKAAVAAKEGAGRMGNLAGTGGLPGAPDVDSDSGRAAKEAAVDAELDRLCEQYGSEFSEPMKALLAREKQLRGPIQEQHALESSYRKSYQARRRQVLREMPREPQEADV